MKNNQLTHNNHHSTNIKHSLCLLANDMDLTTNIGSFFRIADALGIEKLYLCGSSAKPPHPKIKRTSRSTEQFVNWEYRRNTSELIQELKNNGYQIISLEITHNSIPLSDLTIKPTDKLCLIVGSEINGVSDELIALSDQIVYIPMHGKNSSMNVASACSIAVYEITQKLMNAKK